MKRVALLSGVFVLAMLAAATVGARPAAAANCDTGDYYAGRTMNQIVTDGASASAKVTLYADTIQEFNKVRGWVAVDNTFPIGTGTYFLQAGITDDYGYPYGEPEQYFDISNPNEYTEVPEGPASYNTGYTAKVTKVRAGIWEASIGSHSSGEIALSGMTGIQMLAESDQVSYEACDYMYYGFADSAPWTFGEMSGWNNAPYSTMQEGTNSWIVSGG